MPWLRLGAEAAAIIVSILLAFAIDAWWDQRLSRGEERDVLAALESEFQANRSQLLEVIEVLETAQRRFAYLDGLDEASVASLPADSVGPLIAALASPRTFDANRGTVDALVGSGKLGLLQDAALRSALTTFLGTVDDAEEDERYLSEFAIRAWDGMIRHGGPWNVPERVSRQDRPDFLPDPTLADLVALHGDRVVMGYARQARFAAWTYMGELQALLRQVEHVLERVGQPSR